MLIKSSLMKNTEKKWEVLIAGGLKLSWSPEEYVFRMEFIKGSNQNDSDKLI